MLKEARSHFKDWESKKESDVLRYLKQYVYQISLEEEDPEYENAFREDVIKFLDKSNHVIEDGEPSQKCGGINQEIDIFLKRMK